MGLEISPHLSLAVGLDSYVAVDLYKSFTSNPLLRECHNKNWVLKSNPGVKVPKNLSVTMSNFTESGPLFILVTK